MSTVVALRGDHQDGAVDERAGDPAEQVDHQLVGPLHVVEPHDHRAVLRTAAQAFDDDGEQGLARPWTGPSRRTSTGGPSGAAPSRRTGRAPGRPRRSGSTRHPSAGWFREARRSVPPGRGSSGGTAHWRSAPTRCSRRTGAQIPANTTAERLGNVCSISLDEPRLARPRLARHRHDGAATVGHHRHDRRQQLPLVDSTDEGHVGAYTDRRHASSRGR